MSIEPGVDFRKAIEESVDSCAIMLALIGRTWESATDNRGRRRLGNPDDFVTLELKAAFHRGIRVVPILVDGALLPHRESIPDEIGNLPDRNAMRLDHETFESDADAILEAVQRVIRPSVLVDKRTFLIAAGGLAATAGGIAISSVVLTGVSPQVPAQSTVPEPSPREIPRIAAPPSMSLGSPSDIPVGGGLVFVSEGVVVTQPKAGTFKAFSAICTHQGCTVHRVAGGTINCPCHGSKFDIVDGSVVGGPALRPLTQRRITVSGDTIQLT